VLRTQAKTTSPPLGQPKRQPTKVPRTATGHSPHASLRESLLAELATYAAARYSDNTNSTISTAVSTYTAFCQVTGQWPDYKTGITPTQMALYICLLARTLQYKTITNYISMGVRIFHLRNGLPWADTSESFLVTSVLGGVRRLKGDETHQKMPITLDMLRRIRATLNLEDHNDLLFFTTCLVAFFCLLRKGNLTATGRDEAAERDTHVARRSDLKHVGDTWLLVLRHTKTIQYQERELHIVLPHFPGDDLCPRTTLARYLEVSAEATSDILLQQRTPKGTWTPYTYASFMARLKATLTTIGEKPADFAGHSFRRGGATFLMSIGVPIPAIKAMGDWKSDAYLKYVQISTEIRAQATHMMACAMRRLKIGRAATAA